MGFFISEYRINSVEDCCRHLQEVTNRLVTAEEITSSTLTQINEKLDNFLQTFREHDKEEMIKYAKIDDRLRKLEIRIWSILGGLAVIGFIANFFDFTIKFAK